MPRSKRTLSLLLLAGFVTLTLAAAPSFAVVGGITDLTEFSDPANQYYGMNWSYNYKTRGGTSVAIGYFTLLTAAHYSMAVGDTFTVNGDIFSITSMETLANDPGQTTPPDLRVVHVVNDINQYRPLPGFYDLYTYTATSPDRFPTSARSFAIVGTGDTGEINILHPTPPPIYESYYTDTASTRALRWGTNKYSKLIRYSLKNTSGVTLYSTQNIKMNYDLPDSAATTVHESGLGFGDSGGGVFVEDINTNTWKLAGISLYCDYYQSTTDKYTNIYAASIPYYASKLYNILQYDLLPGDANLDGNVDSSDYITLKANFGETDATWSQGDFNDDGLVGYDDFFALTTNFGYKSTPHPIMTPPSGGYTSAGGTAMPEPGSAILLALGVAALLRRRGGESKRRNQ